MSLCCIALHDTPLYYTTLHYIRLQYITLHRAICTYTENTFYHVTLHCITLHYHYNIYAYIYIDTSSMSIWSCIVPSIFEKEARQISSPVFLAPRESAWNLFLSKHGPPPATSSSGGQAENRGTRLTLRGSN